MHSITIRLSLFILGWKWIEGEHVETCFNLKYSKQDKNFFWTTRQQSVNVNLFCSNGNIQLHNVTYFIPDKFKDFCSNRDNQNEKFPSCCQEKQRRNIMKPFCQKSVFLGWNRACNGQKDCSLAIKLTDLSDDCKTKTEYCHINAKDRKQRCMSRWVAVDYECITGTGHEKNAQEKDYTPGKDMEQSTTYSDKVKIHLGVAVGVAFLMFFGAIIILVSYIRIRRQNRHCQGSLTYSLEKPVCQKHLVADTAPNNEYSDIDEINLDSNAGYALAKQMPLEDSLPSKVTASMDHGGVSDIDDLYTKAQVNLKKTRSICPKEKGAVDVTEALKDEPEYEDIEECDTQEEGLPGETDMVDNVYYDSV